MMPIFSLDFETNNVFEYKSVSDLFNWSEISIKKTIVSVQKEF